MNGRRAKFALGFRPTEEREEPSPPDPPSPRTPHSPPPPEEAERIISTLLPKVSPAKQAPPSEKQREAEERLDSILSVNGVTTATQTTFPKTKHQRPYGWEKEGVTNGGFELQQPPVLAHRFASLQHGTRPADPAAPWLPPRHPPPRRSPSCENPPVFPFMGFSSEFTEREHPVTIYPGPTKQFSRQLQSPTLIIPKLSPSNTKSSERKNGKRDSRSDGEMLSPKAKIPPRTLAGSMERHREVCRGSSEDVTEILKTRGSRSHDDEHFSDDSLEESFPPPPPAASTPSKRNSIAWEVSLDGDDPLLTPGSTKVIGRRRRKSGDQSHSSTSSIPQRVDDDWGDEYWPPPPPPNQCEPLASPTSGDDSDRKQDVACGTYVIRKGKNRKQLPSFNKNAISKPNTGLLQNHSLNRSIDTDKSIDGSSISISGSGSVGSYNSRPSSDLSLPQSRYSVDLNSRLSRELNTPNSRYSIDLCTPNSKLSKELTSPKSRLSLDLNNGTDRYISQEYFAHSPRSRKMPSDKSTHKSGVVQNKLSPQNRFADFKKYSSTFDNIQSLIREGKVEETPQPECNETVNELTTVPPSMVRVVSLPTLGADESTSASRQALITTVEEEEDGQDSGEPESSGETSPLRKIENNISAILNQGRDQKHFTPYIPKDWNIHKDEYCDEVSKDILENHFRYSSRERQKRHDIQKSSSHNEIQNQRSIERRDRSSGRRTNSMHKSTSAKDVPVSLMRQPSSSDSAVSSGGDFPLNVQIVEHPYRHHPLPPSPSMAHELGPLPQTPESPKFPPLPPSPVQEVEDEYTEIMQTSEKRHMKKSDTLPITATMDSRRRPSEPPAVPPHRDTTNSLKTRSMETSYNKNRRSSNFKSGSTDRRTLPTDIGASGARRRTLQRQNREASGGRGALQTSASLPETPVFARGCDVPRTPPRNSTGPPRNNTMNSIQSIGSSATLGGYGRGSIVGPATGVATGADLLRMGGPARGWYPRQRHRPASIEHLDRLTATKMAADHATPWEGGGTGARKPLTLPPNLTPKFFHKSPREALRRVTSLLIRKGNNGKEKETTRSKEATSPAARSANGEEHPGQKQRKGFFRSLWKKSRHYSLEHP
ncbi:hypothetical protein O0L34_g1336 [Tuta absoluta]|nr:hypothetical protein O0L34_g1336 [Tuta absoluta]